MGIFRRRKKDDESRDDRPQPDAGGHEVERPARDDYLLSLSGPQARHLAELALASLARNGTPAQDRGDGVLITADGNQTGLENLARMVAPEPMDVWPDIVDAHIGSLAKAWQMQDEPVDPATLLVKLRRFADIPDTFFAYQPLEPLPGVAGVLAADLPDVVKEFGSLDQVGDRDEAYDRALHNLAALPLPSHSTYTIDETKPSTELHFFHSEDFFGAARVMVLPDLLRRTIGVEIPPHGVLVAIPTRHTLNVHVPKDAETIQVINTLAVATVNQYDAEPGAITPDVFHIGPDMIATQLTRVDDEGKVVVTVDGPVRDLFVSLGLIVEDQ